jgi:hypothetical protein
MNLRRSKGSGCVTAGLHPSVEVDEMFDSRSLHGRLTGIPPLTTGSDSFVKSLGWWEG